MVFGKILFDDKMIYLKIQMNKGINEYERLFLVDLHFRDSIVNEKKIFS